jgi:hypothetical protein
VEQTRTSFGLNPRREVEKTWGRVEMQVEAYLSGSLVVALKGKKPGKAPVFQPVQCQ